VEDMRAVYVHHDARFVALGKAVASNVVAGIKDRYLMPSFGQLASHHST